MSKIKDMFSSAKNALKKVPGNSQGKAFTRVLQFFALMIALTLFVKGASGVTMPKVTTTVFKQNEITDSLETGGTVVASKVIEIKIPEGYKVKKIHKATGSQVQHGELIVEFDLKDLEEKIIKQKSDLLDLQIELKDLQKDSSLSDNTIETAKDLVAAAEKTLVKDRAALTVAEAELAAAEANVATVQAAGDAAIAAAQDKLDNDAEYNTLVEAAKVDFQAKETTYKTYIQNYDPTGSVTLDTIEAAKIAYEAAEAVYKSYTGIVDAARATAAANVAAANADVAVKRTEVADSKSKVNTSMKDYDKAKEDLAEAQKKYNEDKQNQYLLNEKNKLAIAKKKKEIEDHIKKMSETQQFYDTAGAVYAENEGTISDSNIAEGSETEAKSYIKISTGSEGYFIECLVPSDKAKQIKVGSSMFITVDQYSKTDAKVVTKSAPDSSGMMKIKGTINAGYGFSEGDFFQVKIVLKSVNYWNTVPLTAIHTDNNGKFVYILEEVDTILGSQTAVKRVSVKVLEPIGKDVAGIEFEKASSSNVKIVVGSSKPLNDGDNVRVVDKLE